MVQFGRDVVQKLPKGHGVIRPAQRLAHPLAKLLVANYLWFVLGGQSAAVGEELVLFVASVQGCVQGGAGLVYHGGEGLGGGGGVGEPVDVDERLGRCLHVIFRLQIPYF